jgi:hypothetical protein
MRERHVRFMMVSSLKKGALVSRIESVFEEDFVTVQYQRISILTFGLAFIGLVSADTIDRYLIAFQSPIAQFSGKLFPINLEDEGVVEYAAGSGQN